jgi:hypothetical protein
MNALMVTSRVKADAVDRVEVAIAKVFAAIAEAQPEGVHYATSRAADGVTFVAILHVEDGVENPLPALPAFVAFQEELKTLVDGPPTAVQLTVLGSYQLFG